MKKKLVLIWCLVMVLGILGGCGNQTNTTNTDETDINTETTTSDYADFPSRNITYICSGSAGGGLDTCARMIAPYIEAYLPGSGTVVVENASGGANWVAWNRLIQSEPDGYSICSLATPQFSNYLNKSLKCQYTMDDYTPLVNCVTDYCTICVRKDDARFADVENLTDLVDYLKINSGTEFLVSLTSGGGADEIAMYEFANQSGTNNLVGVNYADGISAAKAGFLGGETDIYFGKIGDSLPMYNDGSAKIFAVLANERTDIIPEIATGKEQGYDIVLGSSRGIIVPNGMDDELYNILIEACTKASSDSEYLAAMEENGYVVDFMAGEEYYNYLVDVKKMVEKYAEQLGYND